MEQTVTTSRTGRFIAWQIFSSWQVMVPDAPGAPFRLPPWVVADFDGSLALPRREVSGFREVSV